MTDGPTPPEPRGQALREVAALFLRLGITAFGGPAAHIAMMQNEVVERRKWLSSAEFLDLLGATNLIPGPNSTEMAIHIGHRRAGWSGLIVAGACFILPAALITALLAWVYTRFGTMPQAVGVLYGIKPVIIAVVVQAIWALARSALKNIPAIALALGTVAASLFGINELTLLLGAGALVMMVRALRRGASLGMHVLPVTLAGAASAPSTGYAPTTLFLVFLKIGSVLFGSGYVLLAFLRVDLVERLGWLTERQLIDAVAVGQLTPGPVFTTATFIGYIVGHWPGAALATVGIFLPSFVFVAASGALIPRIQRSPSARAFLDGVNIASLGLMTAVTWELGQAALVDASSVLLAVASAFLLLRFKLNTAWLVVGGALIGFALKH